MKASYLAIDIGASSGRHIVGYLDGGDLRLDEVYRFPNGMTERNGRLTWDIDALFDHVVEGIRLAGERGYRPKTVAIDTWGVDYALIDACGKRLGEVFGYRDERCERGMERTLDIIPFSELYARTGIQKLNYNTVFQLMADKLERPEVLDAAEHLLMIPDYLGYLLTGVVSQEYTNATTGAIVNLDSGEFDTGLAKTLGIPEKLFGRLAMPGERVGGLLPEIRERVGYDVEVIHAPSHDTASAVMAMPSVGDGAAYISSGTWSLIGRELFEPVRGEDVAESGFTHEGGYDKRYRFLTNIMGLWIIQSIRRETENRYSFSEMSDMARAAEDRGIRIPVNHPTLMAPKSMILALGDLIGETLPLGELLSVVYHSLAEHYAASVGVLERVTGKRVDALHIIGGGSQDEYLNELTRKALDIPVYRGPVEATAIGNIISQMIAGGEVADLDEARRLVGRSFDVREVKGDKK